MKELKTELDTLAGIKRCDVNELQTSIYINLLKNARKAVLLEVACCDCMGEVSKVLRQYGIDT